MRVVNGSQRGGGFSRLLALILVLVAIVLVAGWFAVRSDGGRGLIESHLAKRLGVPVAVEATRVGWPYVLVLKNVRTPGFEAAGTPGFSAAEVRMGCAFRAWRPRWNVRLYQIVVRIQEADDGTVTPACLAQLEELRSADMKTVVRMTDGLRDRQVRIHLRDSTLAWLDSSGAEIAAVRDVDFRMIPVSIESRPLHYFALDIRRAEGIQLAQGRDLHWEWLTTQELAYIELSNEAQTGASTGGGKEIEVDAERDAPVPGETPIDVSTESSADMSD
jgi:hypothetical protein